jgi:hypothetical protein
MTGVFTTVISCFINAYPNKKLIEYSYFEQMRDILPSFTAAVVMLGAVLAVQLLGLGTVATLLVQIVVGIGAYMAFSVIFRLEPFRLLIRMLKNKVK